MLELLRLLVIFGGLIAMTFLILLALPQSKLREIVMPFVAWAFIGLCGLYALSPVDVIPEMLLGPFGLVDDFGAVVLGVGTAIATIQAQKRRAS